MEFKVNITLRDNDGKWAMLEFFDQDNLLTHLRMYSEFEDVYQIMMVEFNGQCIYHALNNNACLFEDLIGYFA